MAENQHTTKEIRQSRRIPINPGDRFGRLTVIKEVEGYITPKGQLLRKISLQCDCGNIVEVVLQSLRRGDTKSCGCIKKEAVPPPVNEIHSLCYHPLYGVWASMKMRCDNPDNSAFKDYGARGIKVCTKWAQDPKSFIEWGVNNGWKKGLVIDRKDNNKGYDPSNCRFVDRGLSNRNTRLIRLSNTSGYRGVSFCKRNEKWEANIDSNGQHYFLGYYANPKEAARAYDAKAIELYVGHPTNFLF